MSAGHGRAHPKRRKKAPTWHAGRRRLHEDGHDLAREGQLRPGGNRLLDLLAQGRLLLREEGVSLGDLRRAHIHSISSAWGTNGTMCCNERR